MQKYPLLLRIILGDVLVSSCGCCRHLKRCAVALQNMVVRGGGGGRRQRSRRRRRRRRLEQIQTTSASMNEQPQSQQQKQQEAKNDDPGVVQVYILLGQSNMLGMGEIHDPNKDGTLECAVFQKQLYRYLIDEEGRWVTSDNVRNVRVMDGGNDETNMKVFHNEFMTIRGDTIGPEIGIGHVLEASLMTKMCKKDKEQQPAAKPPIMLLKSCIGNRSLGWDLLPPGSPRYDYKDKTFAGYGESPEYWDKGTNPKPIDWYAGKQYDSDVEHCRTVLNKSNLDKFYPGATRYEVKGFFWWQGDKDRYQEAHGVMYETNLVRLIRQLKADFGVPNAKFVLATLGQSEIDTVQGNDKRIFDAMMAVDGNSGKYPDFVGNVATVYSHPLSKGGASNAHYNRNAETYMNVGQAMGQAMAELVLST